jgi:hypothetical protein
MAETVGISSASAGVNSIIANMPNKVTKAPLAIMVARKGDISPKSDI